MPEPLVRGTTHVRRGRDMLRQLNPLWLVACGCLSGCLSGPPLDVAARKPVEAAPHQESQADFNLDDPAERQQMLANINHESIREMITEAPIGAHVRIAVGDTQQYIGTLVGKQADSVELVNCFSHEPIPAPNGRRQCKTSHTPMLAIKTAELSHFAVLSPPKPGFKAPNIAEDGSGVTVDEIVFMNGSRWSKRVAAGLDDPTPIRKSENAVQARLKADN